MKDFFLYERAYIQDSGFPVRAFRFDVPQKGVAFHNHWHEQMEVLSILSGQGVVECNSRPIEVRPGEVLFINSNELHGGCCTVSPLSYYCIIFDASLLTGSFEGNLEQKYLTPMSKNRIVFRNRIGRDPQVQECIAMIMQESGAAVEGYELFVKSAAYRMLGHLFRNHLDRVLSEKEHREQSRSLDRLNKVLRYIEENYAEQICLDQLARISCLSRYRFSHVFKGLMGRGVREYINAFRLDRAETLLQNTDLSVTEVAMTTGFCDASYFSRVFRKHRGRTPSSLRTVQPAPHPLIAPNMTPLVK